MLIPNTMQLKSIILLFFSLWEVGVRGKESLDCMGRVM